MKRVLSVIGVVLVVGSLWVWYEVTTFHCPGGPDGPFETYFENGQLMDKGTLKDGCWDGPHEFYHENGQLMDKGTFKDGEMDGPTEVYFENGQLFMKGTWKDGEECGEWFEFGETVTYDPC